jgi:hypothetical protein
MTKNKTTQQVQAEVEAVQKAIAELQNRQARLGLLHQVQRHGVTRPDSIWFVAGGVK